MNVSAVCAEPETQIVSVRPTEASGSHAMVAPEQRRSGVATANKERRVSTSRERAVVRDI